MGKAICSKPQHNRSNNNVGVELKTCPQLVVKVKSSN